MSVFIITLTVLLTGKFNQARDLLININASVFALSGNYGECFSRQYYRSQSLIFLKFVSIAVYLIIHCLILLKFNDIYIYICHTWRYKAKTISRQSTAWC